MDIVEKLHERHQTMRDRGGDMMTYGEGDTLAMEAAKEIISLRAALADLEQMASAAGPHISGQAGMLAERLGKSIERARAALT